VDGRLGNAPQAQGYDWCIVKHAHARVVKGIDIDTSHFTGNFPPTASLEAASVSVGTAPDAATQWEQIAPSTTLLGNKPSLPLEVSDSGTSTHVRLNLYPDGGVARLRLYGQPQVDWAATDQTELVDLAAMAHGAYVVAVNNLHFGAASNLLMPGQVAGSQLCKGGVAPSSYCSAVGERFHCYRSRRRGRQLRRTGAARFVLKKLGARQRFSSRAHRTSSLRIGQ
jgi:allantoicase